MTERDTACPTNWRTAGKCHVFILTGTHRCVLKLDQHNADTSCKCACGFEPEQEACTCVLHSPEENES